MLTLSIITMGGLVLTPAILIALSSGVLVRRRLIWAACSLAPAVIAILAMVGLASIGAFSVHGEGMLIVTFVCVVGPWIVFLAYMKIERTGRSGR